MTPWSPGLHAHRAQHPADFAGLGFGWPEVLRGCREHAAGDEGGRRGTRGAASPGRCARAARRGSRARAARAPGRGFQAPLRPRRPHSAGRPVRAPERARRGPPLTPAAGGAGPRLTPPTGRCPAPRRNRAAGPERPAARRGADNGSGAGGGGCAAPGPAGTRGRAMSLEAGRPPVRRAGRGERPLRVPGPTLGLAMRCQG